MPRKKVTGVIPDTNRRKLIQAQTDLIDDVTDIVIGQYNDSCSNHA